MEKPDDGDRLLNTDTEKAKLLLLSEREKSPEWQDKNKLLLARRKERQDG